MRHHQRRVSTRAKNPGPDSIFVETQMQDRVFEFARDRQRPEVHANRVSLIDIARRLTLRTLDSERCRRIAAIDIDRQVRVLNPSLCDIAREPAQRDPVSRRGSIGTRCKLECPARRRLD